jgi:hypothetical protein
MILRKKNGRFPEVYQPTGFDSYSGLCCSATRFADKLPVSAVSEHKSQ